MRNAILLLFIFTLSICSYAQKKKLTIATNKKAIRIDPSKPSVFLSFEGFEDDDPIYLSDTRKRVWLKITNNSIWSLYLGVFTFGKENKKCIFHYVEREDNSVSSTEIPVGYLRGNVGSPDSKLKSGASIIFSVPQNHLADNLKIRIDFDYDWEWGLNDSQHPYPRHSVYFYSSDITKK